MEGAEENHQEDHLEEGDEEVGGREGQAEHAQDGGAGALQDGDAEGVETDADPLLGALVLLGEVVVADVRGKVHGESDAHDEVDEGDAVQVDAPPCHVADDPDLDGDDGEADPQGADEGGDEDEGDDDHDEGGDQHALDGLWADGQVLVDVDEEGLEDGDGEVVGGVPVADVPKLGHHFLLHV